MKNAVSFTIISPYLFCAYQYKVQLHTHTLNSDGLYSPQRVMRAYEKLDYTAVAISDHDYRTRTTPSLKDPGEHSIIHIPAVEYCADEQNRSWNHMLAININMIHHEDGIHNRQAQLDRAKAEGGLVYLCHPYGDDIHRRGWNEDELISLVQGYDGIEIQNGASYHGSDGYNYPYKVDLALTAGLKINVIAGDDFHQNPSETMDRGHVVVNSNVNSADITLEDIVMALKTGNYFSVGRVNTGNPEGPRFSDIVVKDNVISVKTDRSTDIEFITARNNYYKDGPKYTHIQKDVISASYSACLDDQFIRIKATYRKNNLESYAWSNPVYIAMKHD